MRTDCAQWKAIRKAQLERFPLCADCGEPANEADHIEGDTSMNRVGVDLQSLCKPCHSAKTGRERGKSRAHLSLQFDRPVARALTQEF